MSYTQAMKHFHNHRKDRYVQPCGFHMQERCESIASYAERTATGYFVASLDKATVYASGFPDSDSAVAYFRQNDMERQRAAIFTNSGFLVMM